jgi:hypothetical protein
MQINSKEQPMKWYFALLSGWMVLCFASGASAGAWEESELGQTAIFPMENAPYPHESRAEGFQGSSQFYPRDPHYVDNSVALFIPKGYRPAKKTDLLYYFHGHGNNIRMAFEKQRVRELVVASGKNVILVFPEGPKDAGDSGLGKLEDPGGLKRLTEEVLNKLCAEGKIASPRLGQVILSGHSGAYRGIAFCLAQGGLERNVTEAYLLDSSYGQLDLIVDWAAKHRQGRLRSIFTEHLANENVVIMMNLAQRGIRYQLRCDTDATDELLRSTRLLFLHTLTLNHGETVQWLELFLRTSRLKDMK